MRVTLRSVMVFVGDVERCADWYEKHFGFRKLAATHIEGVWHEVQLGQGSTIAFHQAYGEHGASKGPTGSSANPHKLVFEVDDVERVREQLGREGVQMFELVSEDGARRCDGLDCEGHRFQLRQ